MIWFSIALSIVGLFLAAWIVLPPPIFPLVPFSVGAPEISPWLIVINAIAVFLALRFTNIPRFVLIASLIALGLSLLPLLQFPRAANSAEVEVTQKLGANYRIPDSLSSQFRPSRLNLLDVFRGISNPEVRRDLNIEFARPDDVSLKMNVYRPLKSGKNPAIVTIYGGAWRSGNPRVDERFNEYIAAQGYTVLAIDYRHSPQYKYPAHIQDVETALRFIQQHADEYDVDTNRIAIMGRSAGGHLAMLAAYTSNILPIRAVVNYYSPVDLTAGYNDPPVPDPINSRDVLRSFLGGTPQELPELYREASPFQQVKPSLPPTLLIYGGRDHIVQSKFGRAMYEKLNANGNTAVFIEIPWAEHAFDAVFNGVSNQLALYYTERFLALMLFGK